MSSVNANNEDPQAQLVSAILAEAPSQEIASALLVGSYGESGQDPNSSGSGGGGAFGFTSSNYAGDATAPPAQQVQDILPSYIDAAANVPSNLTGAAQAEWIALNAERPVDYNYNSSGQYPYYSPYGGESQQIAATNAPTQYGGNKSDNVAASYTSTILPELSGESPSIPISTTGYSSSGGRLTIVASKGQYDPFTETMIKLHSTMSTGGLTGLAMGPLTRVTFAGGFAIVGYLALAGIISGGKVGGTDIPGIVAGFVGGAEVGTANIFRKLGVSGVGEN